MGKVSVDLESPSPYIESDSFFHRLKRNLSYSFAIRRIRKRFARQEEFSILEVGTGSGFFFSAARREFPRATLSGVEYDPRLLETTKKRAPFAHCIQANAETFDLQPQKFDVVVSFQVIEHLYDPSAMLARVRSHLKPGGLFIVTTPNLDGLGARIMGTGWHGYRDDHVSLKGVAAWTELIKGHGFEPLYCGSTFFTGLPVMNRLPLGLLNWSLLVAFGAVRWRHGESFVGVFEAKDA
jgi:2-polyprenyl-3-methyl-5-hydroxy-6-metoxy-1,4-benzoquinol methylase